MKKLGIIILGFALLFFAFPVNAQKQVKATQDFTMKTGESETWIGDEMEFTINVNQFRGSFQTIEKVEGVNLTIKVNGTNEGAGEFQEQVYLTKNRPVSFGEYKVSLDSVNSINNTQKKEMEGCEATPGSPGAEMPEGPQPKNNSIERDKEEQKAPALGPCESYFSDGEASFVLERKEYNKDEYLNKFETVDYKKRFIRVALEPWVDLEQAQKFVDGYTFANIVHYKTCPEVPDSQLVNPEEGSPTEDCDKEDKYKFDQGVRRSVAKIIVKEGQEKEMAEKMFDSEKVLYVEPVIDVKPLKEISSESKNFEKKEQEDQKDKKDLPKESKGRKGGFFKNLFSNISNFFSGLF